MKILLAPHNDDEALFASYIIQNYHPLVVIVTDSYIQEKRGDGVDAFTRIVETQLAMEILGAELQFLGIPDDLLTDQRLRESLVQFDAKEIETVFAPAIEGGHPHHDLVGRVADEMFPGKVWHYSTYTKDRPYPAGHIRVYATAEMKKKKLAALDCYRSQHRLKSKGTNRYFTVDQKDEYICGSGNQG